MTSELLTKLEREVVVYAPVTTVALPPQRRVVYAFRGTGSRLVRTTSPRHLRPRLRLHVTVPLLLRLRRSGQRLRRLPQATLALGQQRTPRGQVGAMRRR